MTPLDVLKLARGRLAAEGSWVAGSMSWHEDIGYMTGHYGFEKDYPPQKYSLYGAINYYPPDYDWNRDYVYPHNERDEAHQLLAAEIGPLEDVVVTAQYSPGGNLWHTNSGYEEVVRRFNDAEGRTYAEVLELLDRTIAKAEAT